MAGMRPLNVNVDVVEVEIKVRDMAWGYYEGVIAFVTSRERT